MNLNLKKETHGNSPAALYLTFYLNEKGDADLNRKVGRKLSKWREVIKSIQNSSLPPSIFITLLDALGPAIRKCLRDLPDHFSIELCTTILIGEIKTRKNSLRIPSKKNGLIKETDGERNKRFQKRSSCRLARKEKINTLY